MDYNYEDEDLGLSEAEQDNYCNLREELRRQIETIVEENLKLRQGNEELMVALEELRERKTELLAIYNANLVAVEHLESELAERKRARARRSDPSSTVSAIRERVETDNYESSNYGGYTSGLGRNSYSHSTSYNYRHPFRRDYSSSLTSPPSHPDEPSRLFQRAFEYARYSNPYSLGTVGRLNRGNHQSRLCYYNKY